MAQGAAIQANTLFQKNALTGANTALKGPGTGILLLDVTPLSLSIETVGGVATRLVERNSTLPVHYSQIFSTAAPYQSNVEINVLQGERPMARDNRSIGKFRLGGIRRAPAGVPQIEVTFDIDTNGILTGSARDLDTGRAQSITITASDRMSDAEVEQARRDAEQYAAQDGTRRDAIELTREATQLLNETERALAVCGKQLDKAEKKQLKTDCDALRRALKPRPDKMSESDVNAVRSAMQTVQTSGEHARQIFQTTK